MDRDRWKAVNDIFHAALERPASERRDYVCSASKGDSSLQSDVDRLLEADQHVGSYLESPLLPVEPIADSEPSPSPFKPGDMLKARFRIVRPVGEGGMGHVFEAYDTELKVRVALKAIRSEIAGNHTALEFFRREVRTARTITHPNVCRTFDLDRGSLEEATGAPREFFFLTMEFLEGETLATRLKRTGPFDPEQALVIARQIGSGLDAAHAAGIVHRDIKPANIMLVVSTSGLAQQTRAVITDFGLARNNPLHCSIVGSTFSHGGVVGTLAYMAPEQLEPSSSVSAATDVYAFGLVLFEMVTGARAFPSANLLSGIAQRLAGPPPSPRTLVPQLPEVWETAIQCCLRLAPEDRFQSAGQVVKALGGAPTALPSISKPPFSVHFAPSARTPWGRQRRFLAAAAILLAVLALSAIGFRLYGPGADSKIVPGALVYLAPVENQTGERSLDNLTELLQAGLGQSAQINLLDQSRVGDTLQLMTKSPDTEIDQPIAREIAMRSGAVRVVFATVTGSAGNYHLNIDIQQPDGGSPTRYRDHWSKSFGWTTIGSTAFATAIPSELLNAIRDGSNWIRHEAGESANDIARLDVPPEDVTTRSWTALSDYTQAERLARDNQFEEAAILLANAVREDQQFALAYGRLGDILLSLHRDTEGYHSYDMALAAAQQDRLTRKEEDRIRGMRAEDTADYQLAIDAFHDFSVYYKNDYLGWVYPTIPLRMLGRDQEAIANLRRAIALDSGRAFAPFALSQELMITGSFGEIPHWISHLNDHAYPGAAREIKVMLLLMNHKYDDAADALRSSNGLAGPDQINATLRKQARLAAERGTFREAIDLLNRAIAADNSQSNPDQHAATILDKSYLECKLSDFQGCIDDARTGFALSSSPEILLAAGAVLGNAFAIAPSTFAPSIRQALEDIGKRIGSEDYGTVSVVLKLRTHGEILLARGDNRAAVELFRDASHKDAPANSREYLGRGLLALAAREHDPEIKRTLFTEAADAFSVISKRPALVWCNWFGFPPGFFADQLESCLKVSRLSRRSDTFTSHARYELASIRPGSPVLHQFFAVQTTTIPTKN
jgi:serine/threonine protein kinase/tetratricopeptide (TPR) repeat protein